MSMELLDAAPALTGPIIEAWFAAVAAPVGRETVPETFVIFHVPLCETAGVFVTNAFTPRTATPPGDVP
jgi:hypothetical protein